MNPKVLMPLRPWPPSRASGAPAESPPQASASPPHQAAEAVDPPNRAPTRPAELRSQEENRVPESLPKLRVAHASCYFWHLPLADVRWDKQHVLSRAARQQECWFLRPKAFIRGPDMFENCCCAWDSFCCCCWLHRSPLFAVVFINLGFGASSGFRGQGFGILGFRVEVLGQTES